MHNVCLSLSIIIIYSFVHFIFFTYFAINFTNYLYVILYSVLTYCIIEYRFLYDSAHSVRAAVRCAVLTLQVIHRKNVFSVSILLSIKESSL